MDNVLLIIYSIGNIYIYEYTGNKRGMDHVRTDHGAMMMGQ